MDKFSSPTIFEPIGQNELFTTGSASGDIVKYTGKKDPAVAKNLRALGKLPKLRGRLNLAIDPITHTINIARLRNGAQAEFHKGSLLFAYDTLRSTKEGDAFDVHDLIDHNWKLEFMRRVRLNLLAEITDVHSYGKRKADFELETEEFGKYPLTMEEYNQIMSQIGVMDASGIDPNADPRRITYISHNLAILPNITGKEVKAFTSLWTVTKIVTDYYPRFYNAKGTEAGPATKGSYLQTFLVAGGDCRRIFNNFVHKRGNEDPTNVTNCTDFRIAVTQEEITLQLNETHRECDLTDSAAVREMRIPPPRDRKDKITFLDYKYGIATFVGYVRRECYGVPSIEDCRNAHRNRDLYKQLLSSYPMDVMLKPRMFVV